MKPTTTRRALLAAITGAACITGLLLSAGGAEARIKLATLPEKENLQVRFDHPSLVMVEEDREIALQQGTNSIDFSWAGTTIDRNSIMFRTVTPDDSVRVISTSYPPGENALTWEVYSDSAKPVRFRVSYLMGRIERETSYHLTVPGDESTGVLRHFFKVSNQSGENLDDANFTTDTGATFKRSVEFGEARRLLVNTREGVGLRKEYVFDSQRNSEAVLTDYVLPNTRDAGLGQGPLPRGKVRVFMQADDGSSSFLGEDWGAFTPVGEDMRLYIGVAQDIQIERKLYRSERRNQRGNVYDLHETVRFEIKNFTRDGQPVTVKLIERIQGEWALDAEGSTGTISKRESNEEVHFEVVVPKTEDPEQPFIFDVSYVRRNVW